MVKLMTTPCDFPQKNEDILENDIEVDSTCMNTDVAFNQIRDISQTMASLTSKQSPTIEQDIESNENFHNSPETQKLDEEHAPILIDSQLTLDVMAIQSEHQFDVTETLIKLEDVAIQKLLSSEESRVGLLMHQEIQHPLSFAEEATKTGDILVHPHTYSQKLIENQSLPTFETQGSQIHDRTRVEESFSTMTETQKYDEISVPVLNPKELTLNELTSHEKYSIAYVKRKDFQGTQDVLNPLNSIIESCNEDYTILKMKTQDSEEIELKTHATDKTCNKIFGSEFNTSTDLPKSVHSRNKCESQYDTNSGIKKTMTPPLPKSRTSDAKEFACIFFVLILGVLAFGVFYVLQGFKPKSNTAAALGSLSGGIILLVLFCCLHYILQNDDMYCLQKYRPNV